MGIRGSIAGLMVLAGFAAGPAPERIGRLDDLAIVEASGIVRSRKHPGIFWVHNDSGNPPALFAVRRDGSLVRAYRVEAPNMDWEDIAADDQGHLYLGDIGNNGLRLPIRAVYRIDEPDPSLPAGAPLKPSAASYYRFPAGGRFDAEGLFVSENRVSVVSKRLDGGEAEVYSIPFGPPAPVFRPGLPERSASLPGCTEPATGADLSADGRRLAVVTTSAARVYEPDAGSGWRLLASVRLGAPGVEAICWDGLDLVLASEDRSVYRIAEATWRALEGPGR